MLGKQIQVRPEVADRLDAVRERMGRDVSYSAAIETLLGVRVATNVFDGLMDEVEMLIKAYVRDDAQRDKAMMNIAQARLAWSQSIGAGRVL